MRENRPSSSMRGEARRSLAPASHSVRFAYSTNKSELGLDHYEHRSWTAWHRHMRLVFLAQLFLLRLQIKF